MRILRRLTRAFYWIFCTFTHGAGRSHAKAHARAFAYQKGQQSARKGEIGWKFIAFFYRIEVCTATGPIFFGKSLAEFAVFKFFDLGNWASFVALTQ
jgi:hypothetical protein